MSYSRGFFTVLLAVVLVSTAAPISQADNRLGNYGHWKVRDWPAPARVKFLDHTGTPWPVHDVAIKWDEADNLDVDWEVAGAYSNCGAECVRVRALSNDEDPRFGPNCTGAAGYWTNYAPDDSYHWRQDNEVRLNRSCNGESGPIKKALVCQELGHALGLDHSISTGSCMYQQASYADSTPGKHQYDMLDFVIYDH